MTPHRDTLRKAAIVVASLDRHAADTLLGRMSPQQAQKVRRAALELGSIEPTEQQDVLTQFMRVRPMLPDRRTPGIELDDSLARKLAGHDDRAPRSAAPAVAADDSPFRFLHETRVDELAPLLRREHPQMIAVVLAHVPPDRAAEMLAGLPTDLQVDVVRRLANLDQTDPEILREIEQGIESWLSRGVGVARRRAAGLAAVASILRATDARSQRDLLVHLARRDRQLASQLAPQPDVQPAAQTAAAAPAASPEPARATWRFDELDRLADDALVAVVAAADHDVAALALAGAAPRFAQRVLRCLPDALAGPLRRGLEHLGPTSLRDIEAAQAEVSALAARLVDEGRIEPPASPDQRHPPRRAAA